MKWIDIKDKLPYDGQRVLVKQNPKTTSTKEALFAVFDKDCNKFMVPGGSYDGIHLTLTYWSDIIAWMPLPKYEN